MTAWDQLAAVNPDRPNVRASPRPRGTPRSSAVRSRAGGHRRRRRRGAAEREHEPPPAPDADHPGPPGPRWPRPFRGERPPTAPGYAGLAGNQLDAQTAALALLSLFRRRWRSTLARSIGLSRKLSSASVAADCTWRNPRSHESGTLIFFSMTAAAPWVATWTPPAPTCSRVSRYPHLLHAVEESLAEIDVRRPVSGLAGDLEQAVDAQVAVGGLVLAEDLVEHAVRVTEMTGSRMNAASGRCGGARRSTPAGPARRRGGTSRASCAGTRYRRPCPSACTGSRWRPRRTRPTGPRAV